MFDVTRFLFALALIVTLARLLGAAARRLGQPPVIGEIIAGILLGPTLFGPAFTSALFPAELRPTFGGVADVGLVLFMFIVGYELEGSLIRGREKVAASVSLGSIALPMIGGVALGLWLSGRHDHAGGALPFALFVGAAMSVTAFPVLARILTDRRMHRTRLGGLTLAAAAVDDIVAWSLLAVVVTIAGSQGDEQWHVLLSPAYLLLMAVLVRPLMSRVNQRYLATGRLTPDLLAVVLVLLLLSAAATEWLGVHFIFGAFIMGAVMPRRDGEALRHSILERLEQLSVLLLLPVFFVVAGLKVDLRSLDLAALVELVAILGVAIGGKFAGAYLGAAATGIRGRRAGALATLMNTRGLTEIVILTVGTEIGVLDDSLFSLMVVMALVTTLMTGPLLGAIYPARLVDRDIADAERAVLAAEAGYRVLAVVPVEPASGGAASEVRPGPAEVVDVAAAIAAARPHAAIVLTRVLPQRAAARLEVGSGMATDLLAMTGSMNELHALARRVLPGGTTVSVHAQFGDDPPRDLTRQILAADPDLLVVADGTELAGDDHLPRTVVVRRPLPGEVSAVRIVAGGVAGADALAALVAVHLARGLSAPLELEGTGRRDRALVDGIRRSGTAVRVTGEPATGATVLVGAGPLAHLAVRARRDDTADDIADWTTRPPPPDPRDTTAPTRPAVPSERLHP